MSLDTERNTPEERAELDYQVHMRHCNQGDYIDSCKYGEFDTCPALLNYVDAVREELAKHIRVGKGLMRVYSLLVMVKGEETTLKDVHDAWSVNINETWDRESNGQHWSLIPFEKLKPETQAKDQNYVDGIRETARILKERGIL
jgi:hypothetical protein